YSVGLHELPNKVTEFMTKYPAAKIDLEYSRTTRVVRDVLGNVVELGILAFPEPRRGLAIVQMPANELVLICHPQHRFAKRDVVRTRELHGMDFVLFERDTPTRKATDKILKDKDTEVKKVAEFDNIETIKRAVEVGFGMAIVPEPAVAEERRAGQLVVIRLAEKNWVRPVGVIYRTDRNLSLAAKKFVAILTEEK
ncbi:MAG: LysR family transcriptional regulator substrate-binding protein, partial [Blastocatellia bacterium]|nr:LysR family transcriptional regulator substrate-binding protein [Blastocatellia bacterium]